MKEIVRTKNAPAAIGPYSQANKVGNLVFTSGIIGVDPETGVAADGSVAQAERAFLSLSNLLEAAGSSMSKVIKTTVFIKNMDDFAAINEVYAKYFPAPYPSRSCVEVARLPKDLLIEIEAIAEV
ncbi:MAG TPA: reactive intermediate/imine deaminase [Lachnospiraceae bacterium]|nr:RidA family protein [Lachnospiraceae bacterium]MDD6148593.1 RidA family protein [Lachnospiraceae bacterium]MDY5705205.1 RidA family protein [Lachnospiraceae bacterium]MEE3357326.1 RidA family protein [Lachnospiraceae bacterium]HAN50305.1 reactive intermediate/imine deaminase [Lachnospiraceae bacterium]